MDGHLQYFIALEIARARTREVEARARLRWGMEPEPSLGRRIATRLTALGRFAIGRSARSRDGRDRPLVRPFSHPSGDSRA